MEWNRIYLRDCVDGMAEVAAGSVDLVFADPPFNIGYEYDVYEDRKSAEAYLAWCRDWLREVIRVLKPTSTFWLAIGDDFAAGLKGCATRELRLICRS
jgi:site-specific DNA-methyltransferase (adenine-specific)